MTVRLALILLPFLALSWALILATGARAHEARGWTYPFACCSGYDCRPVNGAGESNVRVLERPGGYVISTTGEVLAYNDKRIRHSPDSDFHWCSVAGANDGRTICLFVPPRSF